MSTMPPTPTRPGPRTPFAVLTTLPTPTPVLAQLRLSSFTPTEASHSMILGLLSLGPYQKFSSGGWSNDGKTLPGSLDVENNSSGNACYGLHVLGNMVKWISAFSNEHHSYWPLPSDLHQHCLVEVLHRQQRGLRKQQPSLARKSRVLPPGLSPTAGSPHVATFWQYANSGSIPGDQDYFSGDMSGLVEYVSLDYANWAES
ncbi:glycoside hydrolase family 25 protein [Hydnomerulius pinastri MD-312]|uniref:Unplaced genomic scaffold scaffold_49, whole genome shotgun sequence n=1 Tax=Hydnomerulius pinastri MD-312 TaxID=994086 RepID=A0A0C9W940_9AGAM|nr:glycoside hydrolase family 25 protein [Hydnomerulius pinastri MD-312]